MGSMYKLFGRQIAVQHFFHYKGTYSVILVAMVYAEYCFRFIDVGNDGRASDSTIFKNSTLNQVMERNLLNWPKDGICLEDDAFPLRTNLLKPYSHRNISLQEKVFNVRLSRARRVVKKALDILASRFRIFLRPIDLKVDTTETLIWLRMDNGDKICPIH